MERQPEASGADGRDDAGSAHGVCGGVVDGQGQERGVSWFQADPGAEPVGQAHGMPVQGLSAQVSEQSHSRGGGDPGVTGRGDVEPAGAVREPERPAVDAGPGTLTRVPACRVRDQFVEQLGADGEVGRASW